MSCRGKNKVWLMHTSALALTISLQFLCMCCMFLRHFFSICLLILLFFLFNFCRYSVAKEKKVILVSIIHSVFLSQNLREAIITCRHISHCWMFFLRTPFESIFSFHFLLLFRWVWCCGWRCWLLSALCVCWIFYILVLVLSLSTRILLR